MLTSCTVYPLFGLCTQKIEIRWILRYYIIFGFRALTGDDEQTSDTLAGVTRAALTAQGDGGQHQTHDADTQADRHQALSGDPPV